MGTLFRLGFRNKKNDKKAEEQKKVDETRQFDEFVIMKI